MRRSQLVILTIAAAGLSACATAIAPVEITRFHRFASSTTPMEQGSYRIIAADAGATEAAPGSAEPSTLEWNSYAAAVARQLDRLGYSPVAANAAPGSETFVVTLLVNYAERAAPERSPVDVGIGGSTGSYGSGVGVGVGINLNSLFGGGDSAVINTRMSVRITRTDEPQPLWEGRAQTEARSRSPAAQPGLAAQKLAEALFRGFPGSSGETITVR